MRYWTPCWALIDSTTTKYKQQQVSNSNGGKIGDKFWMDSNQSSTLSLCSVQLAQPACKTAEIMIKALQEELSRMSAGHELQTCSSGGTSHI